MITTTASYKVILAACAVALLLRKRRRKGKRDTHFSQKYRDRVAPWNQGWQRLRRVTMALSWGRDCLFPWLPAEEVDHLHYRHLGYELPWIDLVPLNARTHTAITWLRRRRLGGITNFMLRAMYGCWIIADLYAILFPFALLHILRPMPSPMDIVHGAVARVQLFSQEVHY